MPASRSATLIASSMPRVPPVTTATRAMPILSYVFCAAAIGSEPAIGNGQDRPKKGTGKERCAGRADCPHKRRDLAGALLRATAKRRGGEAAMASLLVGHDASTSLS